MRYKRWIIRDHATDEQASASEHSQEIACVAVGSGNHSNLMMAPQEMLDFVAVRAGIKPVFLTGRGFDDANWIAGCAAIAVSAGMQVTKGPLWDAQKQDDDLPQWFREHLDKTKPKDEAHYISKLAGIAQQVCKSFEGGQITIEEEAVLLGYPVCSVSSHYERDRLLNRTFYKMVERTAGGNVDEMNRLLREDAEISAETDEEKSAIAKATSFTPAPFTSFHMCDACKDNQKSVGWAISKRYKALAEAVSPDLAAQIDHNQIGAGGA